MPLGHTDPDGGPPQTRTKAPCKGEQGQAWGAEAVADLTGHFRQEVPSSPLCAGKRAKA